MPHGEFGFRFEKNDAIIDSGGELNLGLQYTSPTGQFILVGNLRTLFAHAYNEWGADLALHSPSSGSRGLYLSLHPGWGDVNSTVRTIWEDGPAALSSDDDAEYGMDFEVGYGVGAALLRTSGTLTPYLKLKDGADHGTLSIGANFIGENRPIDVSVKGTRGDAGDDSVEFGVRINW